MALHDDSNGIELVNFTSDLNVLTELLHMQIKKKAKNYA